MTTRLLLLMFLLCQFVHTSETCGEDLSVKRIHMAFGHRFIRTIGIDITNVTATFEGKDSIACSLICDVYPSCRLFSIHDNKCAIGAAFKRNSETEYSVWIKTIPRDQLPDQTSTVFCLKPTESMGEQLDKWLEENEETQNSIGPDLPSQSTSPTWDPATARPIGGGVEGEGTNLVEFCQKCSQSCDGHTSGSTTQPPASHSTHPVATHGSTSTSGQSSSTITTATTNSSPKESTTIGHQGEGPNQPPTTSSGPGTSSVGKKEDTTSATSTTTPTTTTTTISTKKQAPETNSTTTLPTSPTVNGSESSTTSTPKASKSPEVPTLSSPHSSISTSSNSPSKQTSAPNGGSTNPTGSPCSFVVNDTRVFLKAGDEKMFATNMLNMTNEKWTEMAVGVLLKIGLDTSEKNVDRVVEKAKAQYIHNATLTGSFIVPDYRLVITQANGTSTVLYHNTSAKTSIDNVLSASCICGPEIEESTAKPTDKGSSLSTSTITSSATSTTKPHTSEMTGSSDAPTTEATTVPVTSPESTSSATSTTSSPAGPKMAGKIIINGKNYDVPVGSFYDEEALTKKIKAYPIVTIHPGCVVTVESLIIGNIKTVDTFENKQTIDIDEVVTRPGIAFVTHVSGTCSSSG